jgi:uncharacterized membrane protein
VALMSSNGIGSWSAWELAIPVLGTLVPLLLAAALVALGVILYRRLRVMGPAQLFATAGPASSSRDIADARYARGEIRRDQYNELLRDVIAGKEDER